MIRTDSRTVRARVEARPRTLRVAALAYPDIQVLDVMGPLEVFARTARWLKDEGRATHDAYSVEIIGLERGPFLPSSTLPLFALRAFRRVGPRCDPLRSPGA